SGCADVLRSALRVAEVSFGHGQAQVDHGRALGQAPLQAQFSTGVGAGEVEGGEGAALGVELVAARGQDGGFLGLGSVGDVGGAVEIQAGLVDGGEVDGDDEGVVVDGAVGA